MNRFLLFLVLNIYPLFSVQSQTDQLRLLVEGKNTKQTVVIDSFGYQKKFGNYNTLEAEIDSLKKRLTNSGYLDLIDISNLKKTDSIYYSQLDLGSFYKNISLIINNEESLKSYLKELAIPTPNDTIVITYAYVKALLEQLSAQASSRGKPFTTFQITDISKKDSQLYGTLEIKEDTTRYVNKVIVQGYDKLPKGFLKFYAHLNEGAVFNENKLLEKSDALDQLPFIEILKSPEVLFTKDSTTVYLYAKKKSSNRFDGFIGFSNSENNNSLRLDGFIDLALTNNLNYGEQLLINFKSDGDDQQQLNISLNLPYLFKSPIGLEAKLGLFRRDTTFSETSQSVSAFYQLGQRLKTSLGYKRKQSENLQDDIINATPDILDFSSDLVTAGLGYQVIEKNNLFPIKTNFNISVEAGERRTDSFEELQFIINGRASHIFKLNEANQIFLGNTTQVLLSDNFLTNELFRFGGIISIRGFEENSIFANILSTLNTEYRYILSPNLYVNSIIDAGYFENDLLDQRSRLLSFGFGTGLLTRSGLFKINIANGINEDQDFLLSNTRIHLRLEARF